MNEKFLTWFSYNQQIDQLFLILALVIIVLLGLALLKSSVRLATRLIRLGLSLCAVSLAVLWIMSWFPS